MATVLRSRLLLAHGLRHGFSTREGGVSAPPFDTLNLARNVGDDPAAVAQNHARLAHAVGYDLARLAEASQVHGTACLDVDAFVREEILDVAAVRVEQADALACSQPGIAVGVRTADCVPVLVADPARRLVCAIHAGWRGAVDGVVARALEHLVARGSRPAELVAAIGPHIRAASFEVGEDVAAAIEAAMPAATAREATEIGGQVVERREGARPHASLVTLVLAQLLGCGLRARHVEDVGGDTCAEPARFHSHRRDGARSGRQLSVIVADRRTLSVG